ncbi:MAG: SGNH/GDSL hydrolase family protein [Alicyclobacillus sp.]|nr:SGNH/GDSL hydrolase family protein [Alicyclobacillus sp.]
MQPLYIALGDSITSGSGASGPCYAYPAQVAARLGVWRAARLRQVAPRHPGSVLTLVDVLAHPGWTSADLLAAVSEQPPQPGPPVLSVWVGGDDLAAAGLALLHGAKPSVIKQALAGYHRNLQQLLTFLRRRGCSRILVCTQYNPFPNSPLAVQAIAALNQQTRLLAARHGALLAPADAWFAGREPALIAGYRHGRLEDVLHSPILPVHPNDRGHAWIATHLAPLVNHATAAGTC